MLRRLTLPILFLVNLILSTQTFGIYNADLGRWVTRDPIGYSDGPNMYGYGRGNPKVSRDASGLLCTGTTCQTLPANTPPATTQPGTTQPAQPDEAAECAEYIERCLKTQDVINLIAAINKCWGRDEDIPGRIGCGHCFTCGVFVPPLPIVPGGGPPHAADPGSITICQNRLGSAGCPIDWHCGTLIHELTHMLQWCLYVNEFPADPWGPWFNPDNCILREYEAYRAEGLHACGGDDHMACCTSICGSCTVVWLAHGGVEACKNRCMTIINNWPVGPTLPWFDLQW